MGIEKLKNLSSEDRKCVLESEALAIEEGKYTKPLTEDEILYYKDQLAEKSIMQAMLIDEFKSIKDAYKERLKPVQADIRTALSAVKFSAIECEGKLYKLADFETQMIHKVDELGNVVTSRKMLPEERQFRLQALNHKSA